MRWLAELGGETDEFNQTMVLRAPAAAEADAADVGLQHFMGEVLDDLPD